MCCIQIHLQQTRFFLGHEVVLQEELEMLKISEDSVAFSNVRLIYFGQRHPIFEKVTAMANS